MKAWYLSKTLWVNLIAVGWIVYQSIKGVDTPISPEIQTAILAGVNFVLRLITKQEIG